MTHLTVIYVPIFLFDISNFAKDSAKHIFSNVYAIMIIMLKFYRQGFPYGVDQNTTANVFRELVT